jgi:hypothetical protein
VSESTAGRVLVASFLVIIGLVTYSDLKGKAGDGKVRDQTGLQWPNPRRYVDTGIVYAILGVLSSFAAPLAGTIGAGLALAVSLQVATGGGVDAGLLGMLAPKGTGTPPGPTAQPPQAGPDPLTAPGGPLSPTAAFG